MPDTVGTHLAVPVANQSSLSPLAGKPAPKEGLVDVARLERDYFERRPNLQDPNQLVSFGTSGHRGSPFQGTFTEAHILAITQAICDYRRSRGEERLVCGAALRNREHLQNFCRELQERRASELRGG